MTLLHIDLEFFSPLSIKEHPLGVYASAPGSEILLAAYAFDDGPVKVWEKKAGPCPELREALLDPEVMCAAWNVNYERTVLALKGLKVPLSRWLDVMVLARYAGLPGRLKDCAKVPMLQIPAEEKTKNETLLITKFCMPDKKGRSVAEVIAAYPEDWALFIEYCRKDVLTMRHVYNFIKDRFPFPDREREIWILDQKINQRGFPVDVDLAKAGERETHRLIAEAMEELKELTGLENPNSPRQILPWVQERGYEPDTLNKTFIKKELDSPELTEECRQVLKVRLEAAKASVKKFGAFVANTSPDKRLRNSFVYYGAHTGRWSGRKVQPQNLTRQETHQETLQELLNQCPQSPSRHSQPV